MNILRRLSLKSIAFLLPASWVNAANSSKKESDAGKGLRTLFLSTSAESLGMSKNKSFPLVYGVAIDWPIGENFATIACLADGSASLYTTASFGIIGGIGHASVREAAINLVKSANGYAQNATPTLNHPYPPPNKARFYFLTYNGVKFIEAGPQDITPGQGKYADLFNLGQIVVTELRKVSEK